jgi:hypothetical protein
MTAISPEIIALIDLSLFREPDLQTLKCLCNLSRSSLQRTRKNHWHTQLSVQ